ncbi:hypothetical protein GCM10023085_33060 [Actinomadura viridis]|uniref:Uncharacterized protein n=1 Tax=Actinomadura viridis TaxID=58110 RepID=A0A931DE76_9ACTN|nr:hypothetical protein [Actinomadura viridis]MBG6086983.1 hypothetical protein [Actinomadura viridis]
MSSAVLYLAIVAVWAVVLVPMWLRRDSESTGISRLLHKRAPEEEVTEADEHAPDAAPEPEAPPEPARRRPGRAAVIARRRRRTAGLTLLVATSAGVAAPGYAPWWIIAPPVVLMVCHLALLRVAAGIDATRRLEHAAAARARAKALAARRAAAEEQARAEIIELPVEEEVFDQYADDRRAVGE